MKPTGRFFVVAALLFQIETAHAVEFEKLGKAVANALGTTKAFKTTAKVNGKSVDVFYSKDGSGHANRFAVIQKGLYEPNCTHTWVVGLDAGSSAVDKIEVVEMSCPHAFPTRAASFLDQYKGKGPGDVGSLKGDIHTVAKATGSSNLTTTAVITSITAASQLKGKI